MSGTWYLVGGEVEEPAQLNRTVALTGAVAGSTLDTGSTLTIETALNSTITSVLDSATSHIADTGIHVTSTEKASWGSALQSVTASNGVTVDAKNGTSQNVRGIDATTTAKGVVQLTDSTSSTSVTTAATPNSVKSVYDLANGKLSLSGGTMTGALTLSGEPTSNLHASTKKYVDDQVNIAIRLGFDVKTSCKAATTANITLSGLQTIDGVALVAGDRVLVKNQTTAANNGIYAVAAGAWTRTTDFNSDANITPNAFTFIERGTTNGGTGWVLTTADPITVGTTALTFTQFSAVGLTSVVPGTGIDVAQTGSQYTVSHATASTSQTTGATITPGFGTTFSVVDAVNYNTLGHVTSVNTKAVTIPTPSYPTVNNPTITVAKSTTQAATTASVGTFSLNQATASTITLPLATNAATGSGLVPAPTAVGTASSGFRVLAQNNAADPVWSTISASNISGVGSVTSVATGTGLTGGPITGSGTISHAVPTITSPSLTATTLAGGSTFIAYNGLTRDTMGHVTGITGNTFTLPAIPAGTNQYVNLASNSTTVNSITGASLGVSGILGVANGGLGASSLGTQGRVLVSGASTTSAVSALPAGTVNYVLTQAATGATWASPPSGGNTITVTGSTAVTSITGTSGIVVSIVSGGTATVGINTAGSASSGSVLSPAGSANYAQVYSQTGTAAPNWTNARTSGTYQVVRVAGTSGALAFGTLNNKRYFDGATGASGLYLRTTGTDGSLEWGTISTSGGSLPASNGQRLFLATPNTGTGTTPSFRPITPYDIRPGQINSTGGTGGTADTDSTHTFLTRAGTGATSEWAWVAAPSGGGTGNYVSKAGDTMTGNLFLNGGSTGTAGTAGIRVDMNQGGAAAGILSINTNAAGLGINAQGGSRGVVGGAPTSGSNANAIGVLGQSNSGIGVKGYIAGGSRAGVEGESDGGATNGMGVRGVAWGDGGIGVKAESHGVGGRALVADGTLFVASNSTEFGERPGTDGIFIYPKVRNESTTNTDSGITFQAYRSSWNGTQYSRIVIGTTTGLFLQTKFNNDPWAMMGPI